MTVKSHSTLCTTFITTIKNSTRNTKLKHTTFPPHQHRPKSLTMLNFLVVVHDVQGRTKSGEMVQNRMPPDGPKLAKSPVHTSTQGGSVRRFFPCKKRRSGTVYCEYRLRHRPAPSTQSSQIIVFFLGAGEYHLRQTYVIGSPAGEHFLRPECSTWLYSLASTVGSRK